MRNVKVSFIHDKPKANSLKQASKRVMHKNFNFLNKNVKKGIKEEETGRCMKRQSDLSILFLFQVNHFN